MSSSFRPRPNRVAGLRAAAHFFTATLLVLSGCKQNVTPKTSTTIEQTTGSQARNGSGSLRPASALSDPPPTRAAPEAISPFRAHVSDQALTELRRRVAATRWPDKETVPDASQGLKLSTMQDLVRYWQTEYDWRRAEAKLNAFPQFMARVDGVDVHFIHVRSRHPNALAVIITHGWPGSVFEQLKLIGPLTDPAAHGGKAQDAFDVVIPSVPGFGFSGKPTGTGWGPDRIARVWAQLMSRLGYSRYVAQGGDWGSPICSALARQAPAGLRGIHINLPAAVPPDVAKAIPGAEPPPPGLSADERETFETLRTAARKGDRSYALMMGNRPQTIAYALTDSPAGLAAWMLGHPGFADWTLADRRKSPDEVLDNVTLYWLTNTAASSARIYWEFGSGRSPVIAGAENAEISLPVAITVFPEEVYRAPETWARRAYPNLTYFHEVDRGGHFAAWEEPQIFAEELRAAFRALR